MFDQFHPQRPQQHWEIDAEMLPLYLVDEQEQPSASAYLVAVTDPLSRSLLGCFAASTSANRTDTFKNGPVQALLHSLQACLKTAHIVFSDLLRRCRRLQ